MAQADFKTCTRCEQVLPISHFGLDRGYRRSNCKPCMNARHAEWLASKPGAREKVNATSRGYYSKHKTAHRGRVVSWFGRNPGATDRFNHNRRARKTGSSFLVTAKELERIKAADCAACGATGPSTIDHIIPLSRGGTDSVGNLMPLCGRCNSSKGTKTLTEWRKQKGASRS
jgi:5-methylcytosine-specific restriction endonuclease McrA